MFIYIGVNEHNVRVQVADIPKSQHLYEYKYYYRKLLVAAVATQPYPHTVPLFIYYSALMKMGSYWLKPVRDSQNVSCSEYATTINAVSEGVFNYIRIS